MAMEGWRVGQNFDVEILTHFRFGGKSTKQGRGSGQPQQGRLRKLWDRDFTKLSSATSETVRDRADVTRMNAYDSSFTVCVS